MKNLFCVFFLIVVFSKLNAQKYSFNTLTKYSSKYDKINREQIVYSNSKNDSYFLGLIKNQYSFAANLYDYENLKIHRFTVIESKIKNEIFYKFKYEKTNELFYFKKKYYSKYVFAFQTLNLNDSIRKVKLNVYKNSKKKKSLIEYELEIKNYSDNLFPAFRISCVHPYEGLDKLNIFENGVVMKATGETFSGHEIKFKLEELKRINFELDIPK